jgi:hypothetical protein|nr:MAG TPA: hypothetical protein [Inoviridae sp.]
MFKPSDLKLFLAFELLGNAAKSFAFGESRPPQELFLKNFFRHSSLLKMGVRSAACGRLGTRSIIFSCGFSGGRV